MSSVPHPTHELPLTDELAAAFARMSGLLLSEETVASSLALICGLARDTVPGAVGSGVTLVDLAARRRTTGATDERAERADHLQYELDEGPCLVAIADRVPVRVDHVPSETRWPRWARAVAELGVNASLTTPMVAGGAVLGAVKVYAEEPAAFDEAGEQRLALFAAQAAILVANVQSVERARRAGEALREAVRDRDLVCLGKGVLMGREAADEDTAFTLLVARADRAGTTVVEAARAVVASAAPQHR